MNIPTSFSHIFQAAQSNVLLNDLPRHFYILDRAGRALYINETCTDFLRSNDSLDLTYKFNTYDLIPLEEADQVKKYNESVLKNQKEMIFQERFTYDKHQTKTAISIKAPFRDFKRNIRGIIGVSFILGSNICYLDGSTELTPKKIQCLFFLVKGYTYAEIADAIHLSPRTIEHYMDDLYERFDCTKRYELVARALKIPEIKFRLLMEN